MRTDAAELQEEALRAFITALDTSGVDAQLGDGRGPDLVIAGPNETPVTVRLTSASVADPTRIARLVTASQQRRTRKTSIDVLVADEISAATRQLLRDAGWGYLDRRGRLWFRAPGIRINDTELAPMPRTSTLGRPAAPISGAIGLSVALHLLMNPGRPAGVRELARLIERSPSATHAAFTRLRTAALIDADGRPLVPDLFRALSDVWHPVRHPVALVPRPDDLGPDAGWAISGDAAAAEWGAPIASRSSAPPDLYAPTGQALRQSIRRLGAASWANRAATIASVPLHVVANEQPGSSAHAWRLAHPVVVALDLAQDKSRGWEILQDWSGPHGYTRVW